MDDMASKNLIGMKEEITDILDPANIVAGRFKKGQVLKFDYEGTITTIKITKLDRKNGRAWGQHVELINYKTGFSHYGHLIDATDEAHKQYGAPFCQECEVPVSEPATEDGEKRALDRQDRTLEDGTVIE